MIKYTIKAPVKTYNRRLLGVDFKNGIGITEDEKAAQWFSGREGFSVEFETLPETPSETITETITETPSESEPEPVKEASPRSKRQNKKTEE